jgi:hypothetical protein
MDTQSQPSKPPNTTDHTEGSIEDHGDGKVPDVSTVKEQYTNGEIDESEFEQLLEQAIETHGHDEKSDTQDAEMGLLFWVFAAGVVGEGISLVATIVLYLSWPGLVLYPIGMFIGCFFLCLITHLIHSILNPDRPLVPDRFMQDRYVQD